MAARKILSTIPTPLEFILFAVQQAKDAEKFGFTRNECCRNLKTAIHQYWQNKTLQQHGQSQKANLPRSHAAIGKDLGELTVEHVVPQMHIVNLLMDMDSISSEKIHAVLSQYFRVMLVTKDEHARLNASGLRSTMPTSWDGENILARYEAVDIRRGCG